MPSKIVCGWCGFTYECEFNQQSELQHLAICSTYQNAPVAEIRNGKEFVEYPEVPGLLVERMRVRCD